MSMISADNSRHPLKKIVDTWMAKIELARKAKHERFGKWAEEAMKFFDGAHDWMWNEHYAKGPAGFLSSESSSWMPTFRMTYNRMFEAVALLGPALYYRNPNVQATPQAMPEIAPEALNIDMQDEQSMMQAQQLYGEQQTQQAKRVAWSEMYTTLLTWLQASTDKRRHVRMAVTDALIKGAGYLWCSVDKPRGATRQFVRSVWVNADDIIKDPDASDAADVMWIARYCCHPVNVVEEKYGLAPGTLKGHLMSYAAEAKDTAKDKRRKFAFEQGKSFDLIEYWELYSKNGFGERLQAPSNTTLQNDMVDTTQWGDFCYLAVAKGVPFPLNMPSDVVEQAIQAMKQPPAEQEQPMEDMGGEPAPDPAEEAQQDLFMRAQWPTPFWQDVPISNGWPFVELGFYEKPGSVWPVSIFKPVAGEMRFINWCMSFLADKAASSCQTIMAVAKQAGMEMQKQLSGATAPFTKIELSDLLGKSIGDVVTFLQAPNFPADIWNVIAQVDQRIDKRLGLTELMYGMSSKQMRSATEAQVRDENISIRPDDMANCVEDFVSASNLKEAEAARYHMQPEDVAPVLGTLGGYAWQTHMQETDPDVVVREFSFHIESGTARKPNKQNKVRQMQEFGQVAMPTLQALAMAGMVEPLNAYLHDMAKAMELDATPYLLQGPPPPPPDAQANQDAAANEQAMQQEAHASNMDASQQKMEMEAQKHATNMAMQAEAHDQKMEQDKAKHQAQIKQMQQKKREKATA